LFNLISNAIKYTFKGEITIIVESDANDQNLFKFSVKDTGVGVPPKIKNNLFLPFATYDHF
jgi:two-component system sensor histidine kinase/response regulator